MNLNKIMPVRISILCLLCVVVGQMSLAQRPSRSGAQALRVDSDPADLPCAGVTLLEEDFENGLPAGWTIVDGDGLSPRSELNLQAGWQLRADYDDSTNNVMVSPSWYQGGGSSNDWLILPQVNLGDNPCMSWTAYSLDNFYLEDYEIRVSTTTNDTSAFIALSAADMVTAELPNKTIRAISLADYANQSVFIAIRQISDDEFALVLDDVRISNIEPLDIGVSNLTYGNPDPGDEAPIRFTLSNFGADTVNSFTACYSVNGGPSNCVVLDTFVLAPNQTISFTHPDTFLSDTTDLFYDLCGWTAAPNGAADNDAGNDSLCVKMEVGNPVGTVEEALIGFEMDIYPNPVMGGDLNLAFQRMQGGQRMYWRIFDLSGAMLQSGEFVAYEGLQKAISVSSLSSGLYFLEVRGEKGRLTRKFILD